jgi:hypothetical protein
MIVTPLATAVTQPVAFTVAIPGLLDVQVTALFEALGGSTSTVNCMVIPATICEKSSYRMLTPVTDTGLQPIRKNTNTRSMGINKILLFNFILDTLL